MITKFIGKTPTIETTECENKIIFKNEGMNIFGSAKDRAAKYVIEELYKKNIINQNTTIIESSSGNMGIALAAICKIYGNPFICVTDPHILPINEYLIRSYGAKVIKVTTADENNSYLKTRLSLVKKLELKIDNAYWFNQYSNVLVCESYEEIGREICNEVKDIDYVFVAVSSLGTISGISKQVKSISSNTKIIAVDVEGSKIFEKETKQRRYLSGIGSSIQSSNINRAIIDDKVIINEKLGVIGCHELLKKHLIFGGGSSGCVYAAIKKYISDNNLKNKKIVAVLHDRGDRYMSTVYSKEWCLNNFNIEEV